MQSSHTYLLMLTIAGFNALAVHHSALRVWPITTRPAIMISDNHSGIRAN